MNKSQKIILTFAISVFSSFSSMASDHGRRVEYEFFDAQSTSFNLIKTREEVLAELAEAQRTGDIAISNGHEDSGTKLNELYPERYPAKANIAGKTRQQVLDELAEAQRTGDIVVNDGNANSGKKLNELYPERYPAKAAITSKTRQQVLDELVSAQRSGELNSRTVDKSAN